MQNNLYKYHSSRSVALQLRSARGSLIFEILVIILCFSAFFMALNFMSHWFSESKTLYEKEFAIPRQRLIDQDLWGEAPNLPHFGKIQIIDQ